MLDPLETTDLIVKKYIDYLTTTFTFKNDRLQNQLENNLTENGKFYKGPILEATPPFIKGKSLEDLIQEQILSNEFRKLNVEDELPLERKLYSHQEKAIRKIVEKDNNAIVATGTGSGKTLTFIIPILNYLFTQKENNQLTPGVRALLLYPMNALANDQLKKLREVLPNYPNITFGRYTGETLKSKKKAEARYHKLFEEQPLKNELLSREEMKDNPPHILLTNYAMLEYLMLRPEDHVFFDGIYAKDWKFIVCDEAHTYTGAKGIEMSMLLRRLKERIDKTNKEDLKFIATSATLGNKTDKFKELASFGNKLFGGPFVYQDDNTNDIITADRKKLNIGEGKWKVKNPNFYNEIKEFIELDNKNNDYLKEIIRDHNIPIKFRLNELQDDWKKLLYRVLKEDKRIILVQNLLETKPRFLGEIAKRVFPKQKNNKELLISLVYIANKAIFNKNDKPLLPARYHLFVRAVEGAYLSLYPEKDLFLERRKNRKNYPVFEIGTCRKCNSIYLIGKLIKRDDQTFLEQERKDYIYDDKLEYFLLYDEETTRVPDNEDEEAKGGISSLKGTEYELCGKCGAIGKKSLLKDICDCKSEEYFKLLKVKADDGNVHKCPACGNINTVGSIVWRFLLGEEAVTSVLATSLYQKIPDYQKVNSGESKISDNKWGKESNREETQKYNRKMLIFSDSRQDAAFFSTYLQTSYNQILRRALFLEAIKNNKNKILKNKWRIKDLSQGLKNYLRKNNVFPHKSTQEIENLSWKWVLYEFLTIERKSSLEGLGLLGFSLVKPQDFAAPPLEEDPWNLSSNEAWILFQILLDTIRKYGAILFPDNVSPKDEFFSPRNKPFYFKGNDSYNGKVGSWAPTSKGRLNTRLDYLLKIAATIPAKSRPDRKDCINMLNDIWEKALDSIFKNYLYTKTDPKLGNLKQLRLNFWNIEPYTVNKKIKWYHCNKCNKITLHNLRGICPTYQCDGKLELCDPDKLFKSNHYRNLYNQLSPVNMKVAEHTAQLTTSAAAEKQRKFMEGEINVLSCSTTFELGVDVGELETVFMRNIPPDTSNYLQRAGRAGRKKTSTAFSLTYAQRRSHDLTHFNNPWRMITGDIQPPYFEIKNKKIIKRHIYAIALANFWSDNVDYFKNVESFFFRNNENGPSLLKKYLKGKPSNLKKSIKKVVPKSLHDDLGINNWRWLEGLFDKKEGVLYKSWQELKSDINELEKVKERYKSDEKFYRANIIKKTINTIKGKYLINYMSQKGIIPKYGFPVDVINLNINHHGKEAQNIELNRDLQIALSEYAPGGEVIAEGKIWTSRYLKRLPNRELIKYKYAICNNCGYYNSEIAEKESDFNRCDACGQEIDGRYKGIFVVPEYGFISEPPKEPTLKKPERTFSTRKYYVGESATDKKQHRTYNKIEINLSTAVDGRLAVINNAGGPAFNICNKCGYSEVKHYHGEKKHKTPYGKECSGRFERYSLGYEYITDVLKINFGDYSNTTLGFWESLLYGFLEGISYSVDIERDDIDGCLYPYKGDNSMPSLIIFDDVPGGAGHVKRILQENKLEEILQATLKIVSECNCGGEDKNTSCYGCLRNYSNQYCHSILNRGLVIDFIEMIKKDNF